MSTNTLISTADQLLNTGTYGSFGRFTFGTFNWSVIVPFVNDCGTYYIGGIIDDNNAYVERFEGNNAVAFVNGSPTPQAFTILLESDAQEPNNSFAAARTIFLPFSSGSLTIDQDAEEDYYRFTLAQASHVNASLAFSHGAGDVDMDLRNSSNVVLQSSTGTGNSESIVLDLAPGTYYLHVYGYSGASGSCNRYSMTVTSTVISVADVLIAAFAAPAVGGANQTISVTDTTESRGGASAASTTRFYLSTDNIFDANDIPLGSRVIPALAAGASSVGTTSVTIPAGTVKGKYFLIARADADEVLAETDESNNNFARAIFIGPDLIVSRLQGPNTAVVGAAIRVSDTVKNRGGDTAGASVTRYYLSTDAIQNGTDVPLGRRPVVALDPLATNAGSISVRIPASIVPGDYFLIAKTDATRLVSESREGNNTRSKPITILPLGLLTTESQDQ